jgi:trimeric autotransporter adhesin
MAINPGTARLAAISATPSSPSSGYVLLYFKTNNVLYIQGSDGVEHALGTTNDLTALHGDVSATGPGDAAAVVNSVGGYTAAQIASAILQSQSATSSNTAGTLVLRDGSGGFSAGTITATLFGNASTATLATNTSNVGTNTASQVNTSVTLTQTATSSNMASSLVLRDASGNFSANVITASLSGNVTGNLTGNVTGDVTGNLTGNVTGNVSGSSSSFTGSLSGDVTGTQTATAISATTVTGKLLTGYAVGSNIAISSSDTILSAFEKIQGQLNATSSSAITQLTGDVSATGPGSIAATVNSVGGSSATNIHSAELAANAATSLNTASTIVKRDASGNFSANNITSNLTGNVIGNVSGSSASFTGSLTGDVTGTQGATAVSTVGGKTASDIASATTTVDAATDANTAATLVKRDSSGNISISTANVTNLIDSALNPNTAIYADGSRTLQSSSTTATELGYVHGVTSPIQTQLNSITGSGVTSLTGDVTGTGPGATTTTVVTVGGSSANNIHSAELLANAATDTNTVSTIVKRDSSGNFSAGTITANLTGNVSGSAASFTGNLSGDVTGTQTTTSIASSVVTSKLLTGFVTGSNASILATDSILSGFQKTQGQINAINAANTTDVTTTNTNSINLGFTSGQLGLNATLKLSTASPDSGNIAVPLQIKTDGLLAEIPVATPVQIGTTNSPGSSSSTVHADHVHAHGAQTDGTLHAIATSSVNGFLSAADKSKLDAATSLNTASTLVLRDGSGNFSAGTITANLIGNVTGNVSGTNANLTGYINLTATTTPSTPAATTVDLYTENINGYNRVRVLDSTGYVQTLGRDITFLVKNNTGSAMTKGQAVYVLGADSSTNLPLIGLALANSSSTLPCKGVLVENIANGAIGRMVAIGVVSGINTSAFSLGDNLYVSATTAGAFTNIKPTQPNVWQRIGVVTNSAVSGSIEVYILATHGEDFGTNQNSWIVGDGTSGNKSFNVKNGNSGALQWNPTASRTLTLPDTTDTLVGKATTDILTNKTGKAITLTDNSNNIFVNSDTKQFLDVNGNILTDMSTTIPTPNVLTQSTVIAQLTKNVAGNTAQFAIQNNSSTGLASTDFIANADTATDNNNYADFGINNSSFSDPTWTINGSGDAYIYNNDAGLAIGAGLSGTATNQLIKFFQGGTLAANLIAQFGASGVLQLGSQSGSSPVKLQFANANTATLQWNPSGAITLTLPAAQGTNGSYLSNDGAGNLSWSNPTTNIDGGNASSVYTTALIIDGGTP